MRSLVVIIGVSWVIFWLYWILSALQSKQDSRSSNLRAFIGLRIGIIAVAAILALSFDRLPQSFRDHALGTTSATEILGMVLFIIGITMAVWARLSLGKNWGMPMTEKRQPELVTTGPYRYIRHPIYAGILTMAAGSAIDVNAYWSLVFIVAAIYFIYSAVIEERVMTKQFGKVYREYKMKTKMLVPFLF